MRAEQNYDTTSQQRLIIVPLDNLVLRNEPMERITVIMEFKNYLVHFQ
jgi:hypothetical protein